MSDSTNNDASDEVPETRHEFGKLLSDARKAKNLNVSEVHEYIKIAEAVIIAIEESDLGALPAATFTRGYIRTYARFLEVSEQDVLALYDQTQPETSTTAFKPGSKSRPRANSQTPAIKLVTALLVLAGVAALIYASFQYYQKKADDIETHQETAENDYTGNSLDSSDGEAASQSVSVQQDARMSEDGELLLQQPATDLLSEEADEAGASDVNPPLEEAEESAVVTTTVEPGEDNIEFFAKRGSWMEVRDANDTRLFYNTLPEGGRRTLRGQAPFSVSMGNAKTTTVKINGIDVDLTGRIRANNTARFKVSNEENSVIFH